MYLKLSIVIGFYILQLVRSYEDLNDIMGTWLDDVGKKQPANKRSASLLDSVHERLDALHKRTGVFSGTTLGQMKCWDRVDSRNYAGRLNWTNEGKACQAWSSNKPHSHSNNKDALFPIDGSVAGAKTYCRDPDREGKPWCYTTDPAVRWQYCDVPICNVDCWVGTNSRLYYGTTAVSKNGRTCQEWTEQTPHKHTRDNDKQFPLDATVVAAENYCRDPDREGKPWCYTTDLSVRWEYCDIPIC